MTDRTTKLLLAALALGVWTNVVLSLNATQDMRQTLGSIRASAFSTNLHLVKVESKLEDVRWETRAVVDQLAKPKRPNVPAWR